MKVAITSFGVAAVVSIVACSGGLGPASDLRGGPDGIPKSSTDGPGTGNESPGNSSQDQPGSTGQNAAGNCITCGGTYACTSTVSGSSGNQGGSSFITLVSVSGGCNATVTNDNSTDQSILLCGGDFIDTQDGNTLASGRWTGSNDGFTVTASADGVSITVVCLPSNAAPQQGSGSTSTGSSDTLDGG